MEEKSLGVILCEQRTQLGLSLVYVSGVVNIPARYLEALECGAFEKLPAGVYGELFIKKYGTFLSLDTEYLLMLYKKSNAYCLTRVNISQKYSKTPISIKKHSLFVMPHYLKLFLVFCVAGLLFWYIGNGVVLIVNPPELIINEPVDNSIVKEKRLQISGHTNDDAEVYVNDILVLVGETGEFFTDVNLQNGINVIKIMTRSRHGKERVEYRKVLVENDLSFES